MVQYLPWSQKTLDKCIKLSQKGQIPAMDLELTAKCSAASCIYCDSMPEVCPHPLKDELSVEYTLNALNQAADYGLQWIYTCGLGEPLEDTRFLKILDFLKERNISMSMFTNGQFISNVKIAKRLKESNVHLILKMDTFDGKAFDKILGGKGRAQRIYNAIEYLLEAGYTDIGTGYTDLAFSIVPTQLSMNKIPEVVDYCLKHNIFPSVGELEKAGNVIKNNLFETLGLSKDSLNDLRNKADLAEINYMRPVCPAILTGLHIDNRGNCIVDTVTGLNCKWFLLSDPHTTILGNVRNSSIDELYKTVQDYRDKVFHDNRDIINEYEKIDYVFGGCGGSPSEIIRLYKRSFGIA